MDEAFAIYTAIGYIESDPGLIDFIRDFDSRDLFVLSPDPRYKQIDAAIGDLHSSSSIEWCLRRCQELLST
jgi:hypothetical protein